MIFMFVLRDVAPGSTGSPPNVLAAFLLTVDLVLTLCRSPSTLTIFMTLPPWMTLRSFIERPLELEFHLFGSGAALRFDVSDGCG